MACRLFGAKPLSEPVMTYCQLDYKEYIQWNIIWNSKVIIQEKAFKIKVCEMAAIVTSISKQ